MMKTNVYLQLAFFIATFQTIRANVPKVLDANVNITKYEPQWDSLDTRPLPEWFDDAKIGIFLHWGVYAVPGLGEWFWQYWQGAKSQSYIDFMKKNYPPNFTYQEFAKDFKAEFFNPDQWADLFKKAGAKYVILTSKHHEGYTMWPSSYSFSWNVKDVGPNRDVLGDLANAVRAKDLKFGLYHSLFEWFNPMYLSDKDSLFTKQDFSNKKLLPEMYELVDKYQPWVIWSDGDWEAFDIYWQSKDFLAWLYNESPVKDVVVTNDRWGIGIPCHHGDFYSCKDRYNPGTLQPHKWENAMTLDKLSWGYRRNATISEFLTSFELIKTLAETVSCGGNILINIGPTKEGTIAPIFQERLLDLGDWLSVNGEAIYKSKPWKFQNDTLTPDVWYTSNSDNIYAIVLNWPKDNFVSLKALATVFDNSTEKSITMLGNTKESLKWVVENDIVNVKFPDKATVKSKLAWVLKIED